jgi:hypothetical protein
MKVLIQYQWNSGVSRIEIIFYKNIFVFRINKSLEKNFKNSKQENSIRFWNINNSNQTNLCKPAFGTREFGARASES